MATFANPRGLLETPEYLAYFYGPILAEKLLEEEEVKAQAKAKRKLNAQAKSLPNTEVQTWIETVNSPEPEDIGLKIQQKLLQEGGRTGGWKDELIKIDLPSLDGRGWDADYMTNVDWAEGRTLYSSDVLTNRQQLARNSLAMSLFYQSSRLMLHQSHCRAQRQTLSNLTGTLSHSLIALATFVLSSPEEANIVETVNGRKTIVLKTPSLART